MWNFPSCLSRTELSVVLTTNGKSSFHTPTPAQQRLHYSACTAAPGWMGDTIATPQLVQQQSKAKPEQPPFRHLLLFQSKEAESEG